MSGRRRRVRCLGAWLTIALVGLVAWLAHVPLLQAAATAWIVSDPVAPADAVAVLGGGLNTRPFAAASYYWDGLAKTVLLSVNRVDTAAQLAIVPSDTEANYRVLRQLGVPDQAIGRFGDGSRNTYEEALALRHWAEAHGAHRLIVPTEIFSARRVRWTLHRVFGDSAVIIVPALDPPDYRAAEWWRDPQGVIAFHNEVVKYLYYRLRY